MKLLLNSIDQVPLDALLIAKKAGFKRGTSGHRIGEEMRGNAGNGVAVLMGIEV